MCICIILLIDKSTICFLINFVFYISLIHFIMLVKNKSQYLSYQIPIFILISLTLYLFMIGFHISSIAV